MVLLRGIGAFNGNHPETVSMCLAQAQITEQQALVGWHKTNAYSQLAFKNSRFADSGLVDHHIVPVIYND